MQREAVRPIFRGYDQTALDDAYDQSVHAANMALVMRRFASSSDAARTRIGEPQRHAYGSTAVETLDVYSSDAQNAPCVIFLHGGAWRAGIARNYAFAAETFLHAGIHFIAPDFVPVQEAAGDISVMVEQVRRAVVWVHKNAAVLGCDPGRIYLAGHSSGAHLVGMCLLTDWHTLGVSAQVIRGALCSSGVYDLRPIRLSSRNSYIKLDDASERALSVQRRAAEVRVPVLVSYGTEESPEFVRQATEFAAAIRAGGGTPTLVVGQNYNHFEILETLGSPYGTLGHAMLRLINSA